METRRKREAREFSLAALHHAKAQIPQFHAARNIHDFAKNAEIVLADLRTHKAMGAFEDLMYTIGQLAAKS